MIQVKCEKLLTTRIAGLYWVVCDIFAPFLLDLGVACATN